MVVITGSWDFTVKEVFNQEYSLVSLCLVSQEFIWMYP